jgi:hypothetical protein
VAVAACCDRSRYADLGGAVAAPVSLALFAAAWYGPRLNRVLLYPSATAHAATTAWYAIAAAPGNPGPRIAGGMTASRPPG